MFGVLSPLNTADSSISQAFCGTGCVFMDHQCLSLCLSAQIKCRFMFSAREAILKVTSPKIHRISEQSSKLRATFHCKEWKRLKVVVCAPRDPPLCRIHLQAKSNTWSNYLSDDLTRFGRPPSSGRRISRSKDPMTTGSGLHNSLPDCRQCMSKSLAGVTIDLESHAHLSKVLMLHINLPHTQWPVVAI